MALKVSHTATAPPPELLPAELNEVLRLTQQMLNRKPLMEKMKATLAAFFSEALSLKYERPKVTGNALNLMSLSALHARRD